MWVVMCNSGKWTWFADEDYEATRYLKYAARFESRKAAVAAAAIMRANDRDNWTIVPFKVAVAA